MARHEREAQQPLPLEKTRAAPLQYANLSSPIPTHSDLGRGPKERGREGPGTRAPTREGAGPSPAEGAASPARAGLGAGLPRGAKGRLGTPAGVLPGPGDGGPREPPETPPLPDSAPQEFSPDPASCRGDTGAPAPARQPNSSRGSGDFRPNLEASSR